MKLFKTERIICKVLLCTVLFCCISSSFLSAQIVNIENRRIVTDTTGWSGNLGVSINASKAAKSYFTFNGKGHLQYKTKKGLWLAILDYNVVHAGDEDFGKTGFGHFRYNHKITSLVRLEFFSQGQFNEVSKIKVRYLNGLGARFKLSQYERAKFYFGLAYMNEYEEILDSDIINKDHRLSSYFTFTLIPEVGISMSNTTYIQPLINDVRDYRVSNDTELKFKISGKLKFTTNFHFLFDANPPVDIPSSNYQIVNGLTYGF